MDVRPAPPPHTQAPAGGPGRHDEEPPPVLGSWPALYAVVVGELLLVIALCHWLSRWDR